MQVDLLALAELVERADLVMLILGDKKAGLGRDMQDIIVKALKLEAAFAKSEEDYPAIGGKKDAQ